MNQLMIKNKAVYSFKEALSIDEQMNKHILLIGIVIDKNRLKISICFGLIMK
jgi:hypothetical protein